MEAGKLLQESSQLGRVRGHTKEIFTHRARFQITRIFFLVHGDWPYSSSGAKIIHQFKARISSY